MVYTGLDSLIFATLLREQQPLVVLFSKEKCPLCQNFKPIFAQISERPEFSDIYKFFIMDCDKDPLIAKKLGISGVPSVYVFLENDGIECDYPNDPQSGYDEQSLVDFLSNLMHN